MDLGGAVMKGESIGGTAGWKYSDFPLPERWQSPIGQRPLARRSLPPAGTKAIPLPAGVQSVCRGSGDRGVRGDQTGASKFSLPVSRLHLK